MPKPIGSIASTSQSGTFPTSIRPPRCSDRTNCTLATHKSAAIAAAAEPLKTRAAARNRPLSRVAPVDSDSSRASRAATAPPSIPTARVRCWTMLLDPGTPNPSVDLRMISAIGMIAIAPSRTDRRRFSVVSRTRRQPNRRRSRTRRTPVPWRISGVLARDAWPVTSASCKRGPPGAGARVMPQPRSDERWR